MYALFTTAWNASAGGRTLIYDDFKGKTPDGPDAWARITVRHNGGGQITMAGAGKNRYNRTGTLYVNLFAPPGDGLRALDPLTKIALDAFEGKTVSGIWFRKCQVRELGIVQGWNQTNVLINFSYDEIK